MDKFFAMRFVFLFVTTILFLEFYSLSKTGTRNRPVISTFRFQQLSFDLASWIIQIWIFSEVVIVVQSLNPTVSEFFQPLRETFTIDINGLFPQSYVGFAISLVIFLGLWDFFQYWTHRLLHYKKVYDYLHRFHHGSRMYILTTFRHHPFEILFVNFTITIPTASTYAVVFPSGSFTMFWQIATIQSLLLHSDLTFPRIPIIRHLILLPNHHSIHHQLGVTRTSNFGQYFTVWDRLFRTYADPFRSKVDGATTGRYYSLSENVAQLFGRDFAKQ